MAEQADFPYFFPDQLLKAFLDLLLNTVLFSDLLVFKKLSDAS